jgi:hypothetical protein
MSIEIQQRCRGAIKKRTMAAGGVRVVALEYLAERFLFEIVSKHKYVNNKK